MPFVYGYPSSSPRAHCTPNKSVPTLRYTRRHGPIYTGPCPWALTECSPLDFRRSSIVTLSAYGLFQAHSCFVMIPIMIFSVSQDTDNHRSHRCRGRSREHDEDRLNQEHTTPVDHGRIIIRVTSPFFCDQQRAMATTTTKTSLFQQSLHGLK